MLFWKALEMSNTKLIRTSVYAIAMRIQRERIPATIAYDKAESTSSRTDDLSAHVIEYKSYWLSISVEFTLKDILCLSVIMFCGRKDYKNGALNVVDIDTFSYSENRVILFRSDKTLDYISNINWCWRLFRNNN